ncbi:hypothetical protein OIE75_40835 (plasmid) [Streptomyces sp. NBC_01723]|uniref:hypothetical protein n=1 Tax=Streptomyces sp. NBC_01723 TaxID=2975921 RepID=UPI002E311ACF|nr:hypothetical protein [Streptomyces sp. NBC_01723]
MPWSKLKQDEIAVRRTALLKLRRQGIRYDDERILNLGYNSAATARSDLKRALEAHRDEEAAEVSIYRQQENERLDALLEAAWPAATTAKPIRNKEGDVVGEEIDMRAVDTVLRLMDRRAKLNGLDMPARTELSGPDGGAVPLGSGSLAELHTLISLNPSEPETAGGDSDR